jgi:hypothetical protein
VSALEALISKNGLGWQLSAPILAYANPRGSLTVSVLEALISKNGAGWRLSAPVLASANPRGSLTVSELEALISKTTHQGCLFYLKQAPGWPSDALHPSRVEFF